MSPISEVLVITLDGRPSSFGELTGGKAALVVNVASRCGLTPQYQQLEALHHKYGERGFAVRGFTTNQFAGQEPGSAEQIAEFCSATYGVTFPMSDKNEVELREVRDRPGWPGRRPFPSADIAGRAAGAGGH